MRELKNCLGLEKELVYNSQFSTSQFTQSSVVNWKILIGAAFTHKELKVIPVIVNVSVSKPQSEE